MKHKRARNYSFFFLKILFTNNRTYDELKFYPGDHLNIITGPNGTGKSSIVAAIILGCGGEPALLSRSKTVSLRCLLDENL